MPKRSNVKGDLGTSKIASDSYDNNNIFLTDQGWVYRHWKGHPGSTTRYWDEILVAGEVPEDDKPPIQETEYPISGNIKYPQTPSSGYEPCGSSAPDTFFDVDYAKHEDADDGAFGDPANYDPNNPRYPYLTEDPCDGSGGGTPTPIKPVFTVAVKGGTNSTTDPAPNVDEGSRETYYALVTQTAALNAGTQDYYQWTVTGGTIAGPTTASSAVVDWGSAGSGTVTVEATLTTEQGNPAYTTTESADWNVTIDSVAPPFNPTVIITGDATPPGNTAGQKYDAQVENAVNGVDFKSIKSRTAVWSIDGGTFDSTPDELRAFCTWDGGPGYIKLDSYDITYIMLDDSEQTFNFTDIQYDVVASVTSAAPIDDSTEMAVTGGGFRAVGPAAYNNALQAFETSNYASVRGSDTATVSATTEWEGGVEPEDAAFVFDAYQIGWVENDGAVDLSTYNQTVPTKGSATLNLATLTEDDARNDLKTNVIISSGGDNATEGAYSLALGKPHITASSITGEANPEVGTEYTYTVEMKIENRSHLQVDNWSLSTFSAVGATVVPGAVTIKGNFLPHEAQTYTQDIKVTFSSAGANQVVGKIIAEYDHLGRGDGTEAEANPTFDVTVSAPTPPAGAPTVDVSGATIDTPGTLIVGVADNWSVEGVVIADEESVTYTWTTNSGTIEAGQGTPGALIRLSEGADSVQVAIEATNSAGTTTETVSWAGADGPSLNGRLLLDSAEVAGPDTVEQFTTASYIVGKLPTGNTGVTDDVRKLTGSSDVEIVAQGNGTDFVVKFESAGTETLTGSVESQQAADGGKTVSAELAVTVTAPVAQALVEDGNADDEYTYPLYNTSEAALAVSPLPSRHTHTVGGETKYMPDGVTYWHKTYDPNLSYQQNLDAGTATKYYDAAGNEVDQSGDPVGGGGY